MQPNQPTETHPPPPTWEWIVERNLMRIEAVVVQIRTTLVFLSGAITGIIVVIGLLSAFGMLD